MFLMLAANAAFRVAPDPTAAADVVGAMLTRWHYIALAAPLLLFALELRQVRRFVLVVLFAAVLLAAAQVFVDLQIRAIRGASIVPVSSLDKEDPVRRRFGALHGVSMLLLLMQAVAAAITVAAKEKKEEPVMREGLYKVVVNAEDRYSIWPADRENAVGWSDAGVQGTKDECLAQIALREKTRRGGGEDTSGGGP